MKPNLVAGNWKMNGTQAMAAELCAGIVDGLGADAAGDAHAAHTARAEVVLCPPHILIPAVAGVLADRKMADDGIGIGAQDLDANPGGAYTGQISAAMLVDCGCRYVIVGHSERRTLYGESDELAAHKALAALAAGLRPVVCLGETRAERESGATEQVVARQLDAVLDALDTIGAETLADMVFAYEPVWAIGTGLTATPGQAQRVHRFIREKLAARNQHAAGQCRILYGGSMKPDNAAELLAEADIDGGLVGGASLNAADFLAICRAAGSA